MGEPRVREFVDARGNTAQQNVPGMLAQALHTMSVDAGDRWGLTDVGGAPLRLSDDLATDTTLSGLGTAAAGLLETETHTTTEMSFDALGRVMTQTTPDIRPAPCDP